ncbi:GNAT family N-acetyltransferase [Halosegnis marinus]|uniref:GNAT family N-acetyltransferase n=1 Tax=Halosegnis marinus TaxID=3034023 RepID=UPI0036182150
MSRRDGRRRLPRARRERPRGARRHRHDDPFARHDEREWIEEGEGTHLLVTADGERVGLIGYEPVEEPWGVAELGYFLDPGAWGNGYATAAVELVTTHAFRERRYEKVVAGVYATNPASARVLEKAGFEREAVLEREAFRDGERVDLHRYALFADR